MQNSTVDWFFTKESKWQSEYEALRSILLSTNLDEGLKWGNPCYMYNETNVVLIHGFKEYCALLLFQGALLKDPYHLLVHQTKNVQAARQIRFTKLSEIEAQKEQLLVYLADAIEIAKEGKKVQMKSVSEYEIPAEFQEVLNEMSDFKNAFESLTPGRRKAYLYYFSSAKQSKTRITRIEKYIPKILEGKGLED